MKTCTVKIIQEPLHGGKKCRYTSGATLTKTCELDPCPSMEWIVIVCFWHEGSIILENEKFFELKSRGYRRV